MTGGPMPGGPKYAATLCPRCGARRIDNQIGLEESPEEYLETMVGVFRHVWRVLRDDGTLWLNMAGGYVDKQMDGLPWRLALALQADGWYLRSDIIWSKPNPMPESCTDRPTKSHEYVFLMTKKATYYYDADAIREPQNRPNRVDHGGSFRRDGSGAAQRGSKNEEGEQRYNPGGRNKRTVWTISTEAYPKSHFATFPSALVKPCILAGTSARGCCPECGAPWERVVEKGAPNDAQRAACGADSTGGYSGKAIKDYGSARAQDPSAVKARILEGMKHRKTTGWRPACECRLTELHDEPPHTPIPATVLDLFAGSGCTGAVALELGRRAVLIELNSEYVKLSEERTDVTPGLPGLA